MPVQCKCPRCNTLLDVGQIGTETVCGVCQHSWIPEAVPLTKKQIRKEAARQRLWARHARICTKCHAVDLSIEETPGSFLIELILWLFFIIPGIIYSVWRLSARKRVCRRCQSPDIIPLNTPAAQKLLHESNRTP